MFVIDARAVFINVLIDIKDTRALVMNDREKSIIDLSDIIKDNVTIMDVKIMNVNGL
jgi:hypothetical protein